MARGRLRQSLNKSSQFQYHLPFGISAQMVILPIPNGRTPGQRSAAVNISGVCTLSQPQGHEYYGQYCTRKLPGDLSTSQAYITKVLRTTPWVVGIGRVVERSEGL